jgi:hypothetical protein
MRRRRAAPLLAYCSKRPTDRQSGSGRTWVHELDKPLPDTPAPTEMKPRKPWWETVASELPFGYDAEKWKVAAEWTYVHADGVYALSTVRIEHRETGEKVYRNAIRRWNVRHHSGFDLRQPFMDENGREVGYPTTGEDGPPFDVREEDRRWYWNLRDPEAIDGHVTVPPYAADRLARARGDAAIQVYVTEGEKAADAINALGDHVTATTYPGAAAQWSRYARPEHFEGISDVCVFVDRDQASVQNWMPAVVQTLREVRARGQEITWRIRRSATTGEGDDAVEHLAAGFSLEELEKL